MPLSRTGNIVKSIKLLKTKTILTFSNDEKFELGRETAQEANFYVGQVLDLKTLNKLKETDETNTYLKDALNIIRKGLISERKLKDKLVKKGCSDDIAKQVIKVLKNNDLLNDEGLIQDYIEYSNELLYGENKIKKKLFEQGISSDRIAKIRFNQANELKKSKEVVKILLRTTANLSYERRKQKIYNSLLSKGFNKDIALKALLSLPKDNNDKLLVNELKQAVRQFIKANKGKYGSNEEMFQALLHKLALKGYPYNKIKEIWEEEYEHIN